MAGIQFKVDAVLQNSTKINNLINKINKGATLNIDNTQALQAIQQVQTQINALQQSMQGLNLGNFGGGTGGGGSGGSSGSGNSNNGVTYPLNANQQFRTTQGAVSNVQSTIDKLNTQISGTNSRLQLCVDNTGKIVGGYAEITEGATTWRKNIEQLEDGTYALSEEGRVIVDNTKKNNGALSQQIKMQFKQYAIYYAVSSIIQGIVGGIQSCVNYTKDLNEAMTNIRIVTMDTKEATDALLDNYNQMGQKLGANTLDIAEGAVDWLRQGYSEGDTAQLVEGSVVLSKLALIDSAEATEYLTSALKGYKLEASDVVGVIDQLVAIDLEAATSAGDMAEAMSRTANMARTTGIEMNELLGLIATISETTQNSASVVGNSVKTVLSRMSNIASGKEIDEFGEPLNDVEQTLNRIGVSLRDGGDWRDFYDVLDEIAGKWDELSDLEKSQATTALGGTRQRENILIA